MSVPVSHHRTGAGEPLVLFHGVGHHWQAWAPVLPALAERFEVYACDSPGFGESPPLPPGVAPTIPNYASAIERWLAQEGLGRPHVAGNSMGGAIALELARRGAVRSATVFSPAGFWSPAERRYCQASLGAVAAMPRPVRQLARAAAATTMGRRVLLAQLVARPADLPASLAIGSLDALWAAPAMRGALDAFTQYRCAPLPCGAPPVRVVWGKRDRLLLTRPQSRRARRVLLAAHHRQVDAGHVPFTDAPDAVVAEIVRTVRSAVRPHAALSGGNASD